ncbi:tail fiber domain-containing protein [Sphingobium chungbukense]|uniref:tail fiber domain-containing protein n=1 Tax=Sphingobium chungbukense TaxID=56193 RepID=UPI0006994267|nr:tail fiber domain-containing protein [Sphingobium chungbukense]
MAWYNAGTVAVTNNSATVTGTGTTWADNVDAGQSFIGPDGLPYEIASVVSATSITLASNYRGVTASGQTYRIMPVQGYLRDLATQAAALVLSFVTVRDGVGQGKFPDGTVGTPGIRFASDEDTGFYRPGANTIAWATNGTERVRINGSGYVGIGTNNPLWRHHVLGSEVDLAGFISTSANSGVLIGDSVAAIRLGTRSGAFIVDVGAERMRINTGGNVGIGTSSPAGRLHTGLTSSFFWGGNWDAGTAVFGGAGASSGALGISYNDTDGAIMGAISPGVAWRKITLLAESIAFQTAGANTRWQVQNNGHFAAGVDNSYSLGTAALRASVVFSATGAINTSDARAKQDIASIPDEWLDAWAAVDWKRYKFIDAVQAKGDDARWHLGLVAQAVRDAFSETGLDAQAIGLLCYDQWDEKTEPVYETVTKTRMVERQEPRTRTVQQERPGFRRLDPDDPESLFEPFIETIEVEETYFETVEVEEEYEVEEDTGETRVTLEAGDRWGLRYDECQAMEAAWQRRELARKDAALQTMEATIATLSARLSALDGA